MLQKSTSRNFSARRVIGVLALASVFGCSAAQAQIATLDSTNDTPLYQELRSASEIIAWAAYIPQEIVHFDYDDVRMRRQEASFHFTPNGYESFNKFLKQAQIINIIQTNYDGVRINIDGAPEIISSGVESGVYTWNITIPTTVTFNGRQPPPSIKERLALRIVRVSTSKNHDGCSKNPDGLAIDKWEIANP